MTGRQIRATVLIALFGLGASHGTGWAQASAASETDRPAAALATTGLSAADTDAAPPHDPGRGAVTNLPLPRYVTLKTGEGNARRGPGRTHRIDWVFTRAGMPLKVTAEHENWRRVEDADGVGGWVHYSLLSGVRSVLVADALLDLHASPQDTAPVILRAENGVIGKLLDCQTAWCRIAIDGEKGWAMKSALWGVEPGEILN